MPDWLIDEGASDPRTAFIGTAAAQRGAAGKRAPKVPRNLAVFLKSLIVTNTRKWFGEAELRLDALVAHGGAEGATLFHPQTFRFPRVQDGDDLAGRENGLLIFLGRPEHFLVLSLTLSRDTRDSDDLAALIQKQAKSAEVSSLVTTLAAAASPHVAAVQAAFEAARSLGDVAYGLVRQVSPNTLGLYRGNWLERTHAFGIGSHPESGTTPVKDFELRYQITEERTG